MGLSEKYTNGFKDNSLNIITYIKSVWNNPKLLFNISVSVVIVVLLAAIGFMSYSRKSNIDKGFETSLAKETKYEYNQNYQIESSNKLKNISGLNILIYESTSPQNIKETESLNKSEYMYVLPINSDILRMYNDGQKGLVTDITIIVLMLLLIGGCFYYYYKKIINSYYARAEELRKFKEVFNNINGIDDFKCHYNEIGKAISNIGEYIKNSWWEFCETLIIVREDEDCENPNSYDNNSPISILKNTDQIEVYFNSETIIDKQINKEEIDVIPNILTGLGLVGTFLAIAIALINFDMGHIELSIQNLLGGLSIKFISSLTGIATSIWFLYQKSRLFSELENLISAEQSKLNSIFPRRTAESYLCYMWQNMQEQQKILKNMEMIAEDQKQRAEKVVEDFGSQVSNFLKSEDQNGIKEILDMIAKRLGDSITYNLKEYMERLEKSKNESSTEALEKILGELTKVFTDGSISDTIQEAQRVTATSISSEMNNSITNMSTQNARLEDLAGTIGSYIEQLQGYESRVENNYSELLANMEKAVNSQREFIGQNERFVQNISEASYKINSTSSNLDDVSSNIANISESLQDNMSKSNLVVQNGTETIQSLISRTEYVNKLLADSFDKFGEQASEKLTNLFSIYTESIQKVCGNIQAAVGELSDERIDELKDSIDELNKNISQYLKERV